MTSEELRVRIVVDTSDLKRSVAQAKRTIEGINDSTTKGIKSATTGATSSIQELQGTMEQVRNMEFLSFAIDQLDTVREKLDTAIEGTKILFSAAANWAKNAGEEILGAFDFSRMDVGDDGFKGYIESFAISMREASRSIQSSIWTIGSGFKFMGKTIMTTLVPVIAKLGVFAAVIATVANVVNTFQTAVRLKQINAEAQKIGLSVNAYQEWAYILEKVGVEADNLSDFIKTLSEEQQAVREGSEDMTAAFNALGLSAERVSNMSQEALFSETVKRLQNIENEVERTSLAYRIFGEDAAELANVIRLTNEETAEMASTVHLLGNTISGGLLAKSTRLSAAILNLKMAWQGFTNTMAELFMPVITKVVEWLTKAIVVVNIFLKTIFGLDMTPAASAISNASGSMGSYTDSIEGATSAVEKLKRATMGFDELNIVSNPNASSGSGSGGNSGTGVGSGAITETQGALDKAHAKIAEFQKKIQDFMDKWKTEIQIISGALAALSIAGMLESLGKAVGLGDKFLDSIGKIKNIATSAIVIVLQYSVVNEYLDKYIDGKGFKEYLKGLLVAALGTGVLYAMWGPAGLAIGLAVTATASIKAVIDNGGIDSVESAVVALTGLASALGAVVVAWKSLGLASLLGDFGAFIALLKEGNSIGSVMAAAFPKLSTAIGAVVRAVAGFVAGLSAGTLAAIAAAIVAVISVVVFLKENWEAVTEAVKKFFETNIVPKLDAIKQSWENIKTSLASAGQAFLDAIPPEFKEALIAIGTKIGEIVQGIADWLAQVDILGAIGTAFEVLGGIIFAAVSGVIMGAFEMFIGTIESLSKIVEGLVDIFAGTIELIVGLCTGDLKAAQTACEKIGEGIVKVFKGLYNLIVKPIEDFVNGVIDWFVTLWDELVGHSIVPDMIDDIVEWFGSLGDKIFGPLKQFVDGVIQKFKDMWTSIKTWFNSNVAPKFTKDYWSNKFDVIRTSITEKLNAAKTSITSIWTTIRDWFTSNIAPKFTVSYWANKFGAIKDGARQAFNNLITIVESAINGIINKLNTLSFSIPSWVPGMGGSVFGFNFRQVYIPRLASGGITTGSTIANIGENGREAVLPLDRNTQWMDRLADRIAARNQAPTKIVLKVGERELGWASINGINQITKQTGELQLAL
ncbi:MAG: hypothetical protein IKY67_06635 [Paludibacteraceae bacterium]|nr:hypothetical protein [Paludibacteraceae bacterium]